MPVNSKNIFVGLPDQLTTGAIMSAAETDTVPANIDAFVWTGKQESGYISEEGVTITPSDSTESIKDWSGAELRRILTEFTGEIAWEHLELSQGALENYFGTGFVSVVAATSTKGTQVKASLGKNVLPTKSWYFKVKDGARRMVIFVPHGQVVSRGEITLLASDAVKLPVTLATYPDAAGQNIYLFTDDGVFSA